MTLKQMEESVEIFKKFRDDDYFEFGHDVIYACPSEAVPEEYMPQLEKLGWYIENDYMKHN